MGSYSDIPQVSLPQSADLVARVRERAEYNMKRYESRSPEHSGGVHGGIRH